MNAGGSGEEGGGGATRLGEKLTTEVKVESLNEIFKALRDLEESKGLARDGDQSSPRKNILGIEELDNLIPDQQPAIIELVSPPATHHPSGAGKTSLLYLIIAHAILPKQISPKIPLPGHDAAVIIFDPLSHFSVLRLTTVLLNILTSSLAMSPDASTSEEVKHSIQSLVQNCLQHVHIFRPSSFASLIATLRNLPTYLFDSSAHKSISKRIHAIILEDTHSFIPTLHPSYLNPDQSLSKPDKSSTSSSSLSISTASANTTTTTTSTVTSLSDASTLLTSHLRRLSASISPAAILISSQHSYHHIYHPSAAISTPSTTTTATTSSSSFPLRPALPLTWPLDITVTRWTLNRAEVLRFAPRMSIEEAETEREQRWGIVAKGRFEVRRVAGSGSGSGGGDSGTEGNRNGIGCVIRVGGRGEVSVEK